MTFENLRRVKAFYGGYDGISEIFTSEEIDHEAVGCLVDFTDISGAIFNRMYRKTEPWDHKRVRLDPNMAYLVHELFRRDFGEPDLYNEDPDEIKDWGFAYTFQTQACVFSVIYEPVIPQLQLLGTGPKEIFKQEFDQFETEFDTKIKLIEKQSEPPTQQTRFTNPFHKYFSEGRAILDVLLEQETDSLNSFSDLPPGVSTLGAFFLFVAAFEGLINVIYELYMESSFRNDERVYDNLKRSHIDLKVRMAPAYCTCFREKIIETDENFKKLQAVINLRNDLIHANLTQAMVIMHFKVGNVTFNFPRVKKRRYGLPDSPTELNVKHLQFVCDTIENMVNVILKSMKVRYQQELSRVIHRDSFVADFTDGEYVIDLDALESKRVEF